MPDSPTRGESANRGESPRSCERTLIAVQLEALGHGGCAFDLEAADDLDAAAVAYSIVEHLEENCGAPRDEDQDIAARLKAWADRHDKLQEKNELRNQSQRGPRDRAAADRS